MTRGRAVKTCERHKSNGKASNVLSESLIDTYTRSFPILYIDENNQIPTICEILRQNDYRVAEMSAIHACECLSYILPVVVIVNIDAGPAKLFYYLWQMRLRTQAFIIALGDPGNDRDEIISYEMGADDYVIGPYTEAKVLAHLRAKLRRANGRVEMPAANGDSKIRANQGSKISCIAKNIPHLQRSLLYLLAGNLNRSLSAREIASTLYANPRPTSKDEGAIRTLVSRLRHSLRKNLAGADISSGYHGYRLTIL